MKVKLYTVPASHPGKTAAAMLAHKGIPYKRTDLLPFVSRTAVRVIGFPDKTVPAMVIDGRKIQKSRAIGQELDRLQPDPPLYPSDPDAAEEVLEVGAFRRRRAAVEHPPDRDLGIRATTGGAAELPAGIEASASRSASPRKPGGR